MNDQLDYQDRGLRITGAVSGFAIGALIGAGLALLFAPAPGSDTRRRLGSTAKKLRDEVGDVVNRTGHEINKYMKRGETNAHTMGQEETVPLGSDYRRA